MVEKESIHQFTERSFCCKTKSGAALNATTKKRIKNDLLKYSMAAIEPVIIDPTTLYIRPKTLCVL